jgi:hypothetical protein
MYKITDYTKQQAKLIGVDVKPSEKPGKKIDIYKNNKYITSVGDINYGDYPTFIKENGKTYAEEKRKAFHKRFGKRAQQINSNSYYALKLLW